MRGLQAEMRPRGARLGRQHGVDKLAQGIGTSIEAGMQVGAEGAECSEVLSGHTAQLARTTGGRPLQSPTSLVRVKSQAKSVLHNLFIGRTRSLPIARR
jgi:hypothetical protein